MISSFSALQLVCSRIYKFCSTAYCGKPPKLKIKVSCTVWSEKGTYILQFQRQINTFTLFSFFKKNFIALICLSLDRTFSGRPAAARCSSERPSAAFGRSLSVILAATPSSCTDSRRFHITICCQQDFIRPLQSSRREDHRGLFEQ